LLGFCILASGFFFTMHKLSRSNRDKLQQFVAITGASEKNALQALKASDWHLEAAFDVFYSQPQPRSNAAEVRRLEELYNRYKGKLLVVTLLS
jgi:DCN1-like protein 1/2